MLGPVAAQSADKLLIALESGGDVRVEVQKLLRVEIALLDFLNHFSYVVVHICFYILLYGLFIILELLDKQLDFYLIRLKAVPDLHEVVVSDLRMRAADILDLSYKGSEIRAMFVIDLLHGLLLHVAATGPDHAQKIKILYITKAPMLLIEQSE